jgi:hypothetical protein
MSGDFARRGLSSLGEPVLHELAPLEQADHPLTVRLAVRKDDDGTWYGRLIFEADGTDPPRTTAEIFCEASETDLWRAVQGLQDHHLRDLHRSVSQ